MDIVVGLVVTVKEAVDVRFVTGVSAELINNGLVFGCNGGCKIKPVSEKSKFFFVCECEEEFREMVVEGAFQLSGGYVNFVEVWVWVARFEEHGRWE